MKNQYKTSDLSLAAYLNINQNLESVEKGEGQKVVFVFAETTQLKIAVDDFWRRKALVEPASFFNSLKNLKSMIYQRRI